MTLVAALLVASLAASPSAPASHDAPKKRQKVAVLDIDTLVGMDAGTTRLLSESLVTEVARVSGAQVIGKNEISALVGFDRQRQMLGCNEESCLAEIGGALGVDLLVRSSVGKIGESHVLNLQLLDVRRALVVARSSRRVQGGPEGVLDVLPAAVNELWHPSAPAAATAKGAPGPSSSEVRAPRWPWALVAVGAVGAGAGGYFGYRALGEADEVARLNDCVATDACPEFRDTSGGLAAREKAVDDGAASAVAAYNRDARLAAVAGGAGVVSAVVGAVLLFTLEGEAPAVAVTPLRDGGAMAVAAVAF